MPSTPRKPRATSTRQRTSARPGPAVVKRAEIGEQLVALITAPEVPLTVEGPADRPVTVEPTPDTVAPSTEPEAVEITLDLSDEATATPVQESHEDTASTEEVTPKEEVEVTAPAKLTVVPDAKPAKAAATKPATPKVVGLVAGRLENQTLVNRPTFLANWASTRPVVHVKGTACDLPKNVTEKARKDVLPIFQSEQKVAAAKGKRTCLFCIRCTVEIAKAAPAPKAPAPVK